MGIVTGAKSHFAIVEIKIAQEEKKGEIVPAYNL